MIEKTKKTLELFNQLRIPDMPVGYYLLGPDCSFLKYSERFREILQVSDEQLLGRSIADFHSDPAERAELLELAIRAEKNGKFFEGDAIRLKVDGREIFLRESICPLRDPKSREILGYFGCVVDVTSEIRLKHLFNHLPVGIYRLDKEDLIVETNDILARMLGYASKNEILNRKADSFYRYADEERMFKNKVLGSSGDIVKTVIELVKSNGEYLFANLSSVPLLGNNSEYVGREGTILDVTTEEHFRRSLDNVPAGFYLVNIEGEREIIRQCNEYFARMFGFNTPDEVKGRDIKIFYVDEADHKRFIEDIILSDPDQPALTGYELKVQDIFGDQFFIEVNTRLIFDQQKKIVGRTGFVRKIPPREKQVKEQLKGLQNDIGRVLHSYTSTLLAINSKITPSILAFGPDPFALGKYPSNDDVEHALQLPTSNLLSALNKFIANIEPNWADRNILPKQWDELIKIRRLFSNLSKEVPYREHWPSTLHKNSRLLIGLCVDLRSAKVSKQEVKEIIILAENIGRITSLANLHKIQAEIIAMDHEVNMLRDVVTSDVRVGIPRVVCLIIDLIAQASSNLKEFAFSRGVEITLTNRTRGIKVEVNERDILRALGNVIHNAIKYSWDREKGVAPWIDIVVYQKDHMVYVEIENFGVPIPEEEIASGLIFVLGYRGRLSSDRGRLGTGIGLADTLTTMQHHDGTIDVKSNPANPLYRHDDYTKPFLTKITLGLPIFQGSLRR